MYLFLCIFALFLFGALKHKKNESKAKRIYIYIMTFTLCFFSAIRNIGAGVDTYQYYLGFTAINYSSWASVINDVVEFLKGNPFVSDPGFTLYTKLFSSICGNFYIYSFFIALVFISAIGRIIYKSVENFSGYVLCYGYYISLMYFNCPNNLMRQTLAMGILLWAMIFIIEKRQYVRSVLMIVVAITIHKSSLLGLIPVCLLFVHNVRFIYWSGLVLMPIIMKVGPLLVTFLALNSGSEKYMMYVGLDASSRPVFYIVEMLIFYIIGLLSLGKVVKTNLYIRESYMCFALAIAFVALLWVSSDMIRITYYFSVWGIPFVGKSVQMIKRPLKKIAYLMILLLVLGRTAMEPMPYKFYWQKMDLHERYDRYFR